MKVPELGSLQLKGKARDKATKFGEYEEARIKEVQISCRIIQLKEIEQ